MNTEVQVSTEKKNKVIILDEDPEIIKNIVVEDIPVETSQPQSEVVNNEPELPQVQSGNITF